MINGLEGIPGSGKSYEGVVFHVLHALQRGRMVITNLPLVVEMFAAIDPSYEALIVLRRKPTKILGTWDADRIDDKGNGSAFELFEDGHTSPVDADVTVFGHVWDYYTTWKHPQTGQGPLFVVSECHVPLPVIGTDPRVVEWFKLHRHFNVDVLLDTQSFRDINQPIARLIAMLIRVRNADILGKKDCYIRKVHSGYRGAVVSTDERKYQSQYFPLYKSHTQGNSVAESSASDVKPFIVYFNRLKWAWLALSAVVCLWAFWPAGKPAKPKHASSEPIVEMLPQPGSPPVQSVHTDQPPPSSRPTFDQPVADDEMPEPFLFKGIHLTGRAKFGDKTVYTFTLSNNGIYVATVTSSDMQKIGYVFEPLTDCAGSLRWKTKVRAITCDSPPSVGITMPQGQPVPSPTS